MNDSKESALDIIIVCVAVTFCVIVVAALIFATYQDNKPNQTSHYAFAGHPIQCNEDGSVTYIYPVHDQPLYNPIAIHDEYVLRCHPEEGGIHYYYPEPNVTLLVTVGE